MSTTRPITKLLVANRGEIAVRIIQTAAARGIETVAIAPTDDLGSGHTSRADHLVEIAGTGPAAYLDIAQVVGAATAQGCDAVHPGYGFLSENPEFAEACAAAGLVFVGPTPQTLRAFGDKTAARRVAEELSVPLLRGTTGPTTLQQATDFFDSLGEDAQVMVKAIAGGGGRGMAPVAERSGLATAYDRCASEAKSAFGNGDLYVEELLGAARHIEVQIIGDGQGAVSHLWDRDCSVQRRRQKVVELAPAQLPVGVRAALLESAVRIGESLDYRGLGTVEFLVEGDRFAFLEVNPRIQVEHTVTEEILGLDLVEQQLRIADGATLAELGLTQDEIGKPTRTALQLRVTTDTLTADGSVVSGSGTLTAFQPPSGPSVRVDTHAHAGMAGNPRYDSLLAKVIVSTRSDDLAELAARGNRALREFGLEGVSTNIPLIQAILAHPEFLKGAPDTNFVERHLAELLDAPTPAPLARQSSAAAATPGAPEVLVPEGSAAVRAPMAGVVVSVDVSDGDTVAPGGTVLVLEAMKMEHVVVADDGGSVDRVLVKVGDVVDAHQVLAVIAVSDDALHAGEAAEELDLDRVRPDLAELLERKRVTTDEARPDAVAKRRKAGRRTARENIADLCDDGSFVEYGGLLLAAQRQRRSLDHLVEKTPADGLVGGVGTVSGHHAVVMSYDYTVMAGTQGFFNHAKMRRLFELAHKQRLPVVMFVEGGGGRPGDTDMAAIAQLDETTFSLVAQLSGKVPLVAIAAGRTFAGNAALAS
ncbi:MAG TPA: biotin carboxylase N-terminal domain-containing protein, partial [Nocardioides sp.]